MKTLKKPIENFIRIIEELKAENEQLKQQNQWLMEQFRLSKHKQYGASSEQSNAAQISLFNETEATTNLIAPEPSLTEVKTHYRKRTRLTTDKLPEELPVEVIEHELPQDERICSNCSGELHVMGRETREDLKIIPAKAVLVRHVCHVYACRCCENTSDHVPIVKAHMPEPVIKGGFASPESIAHIATQKFMMASPLYRQEQEWKQNGILLSRQTMSNWLIKASDKWLEPIYEAMKHRLCKHDVLHGDETRVQVLHEDGRKATTDSWMWVYRSGELCNGPPIILFNYETTRGGYHPKQYLEGYSGYLIADGYDVYHKLPENIVVSGCFAHARRRYDECLKSVPEKERKGTIADEAIKRIALLYKIEAILKDKSTEERYEGRLKQSKPVLDAYFQWLKSMSGAIDSGSLIGKAINYSLKQQQYLMSYLLDGSISIDNNAVERSIRIFATGRKNWEFCNTPNGAKASAIIYSITETAKANGLKPYEYLVYVFETIPKHYMGTSRDFLRDLLPWSDKIPETCKSKKNNNKNRA